MFRKNLKKRVTIQVAQISENVLIKETDEEGYFHKIVKPLTPKKLRRLPHHMFLLPFDGVFFSA